MKLNFLRIAALFGFLSVAMGAFAAHALKTQLSEYSLQIWQTAVHYQMFHSLALLAIGLFQYRKSLASQISSPSKSSQLNPSVGDAPLRFTAICWSLGILIFSGSLYMLALTDIKWLGAITPIGGVLFLIGWGRLVFVRIN